MLKDNMLENKNIMLSNTLNIFKYVGENTNGVIKLIKDHSKNEKSKRFYMCLNNTFSDFKTINGKGSKKCKKCKPCKKRKKSINKGGSNNITMSQSISKKLVIIGCIFYLYIAFGWIPISIISGLGIGFIALDAAIGVEVESDDN